MVRGSEKVENHWFNEIKTKDKERYKQGGAREDEMDNNLAKQKRLALPDVRRNQTD